MNRKVVGLIVAIALAGFGTVALAAYVSSAEDRALEGQELVEVYVVDDEIAAGASDEDVKKSVRREEVPAKVVPDGAVVDVTQLDGLVAAVALVPGEQLLIDRFQTPVAFDREQTRAVDVPPGLQEVTLSLEPYRAVGGSLLPGDTVGVFISFDPFELDGVVDIDNGVAVTFDDLVFDDGSADDTDSEADEADRALKTPNTTHLTLHKVLVTNVQLEQLPETVEPDEDGEMAFTSSTTLAPTGKLLVTLALDAPDAERLIFGGEFGYVWLSAEPVDADELGTRIQTRGTLYLDGIGAN